MKPRMTDVVLPPTFEQTASFTPGPWRWDGGALEQDVPGNNGNIILGIYDDGCTKIDNEYDASLIAAAPELLAALCGVVAVADRETDEFIRARAAIAKAKGGTQ